MQQIVEKLKEHNKAVVSQKIVRDKQEIVELLAPVKHKMRDMFGEREDLEAVYLEYLAAIYKSI